MQKSELSLSDEWETPKELYDHLCEKYKIHPQLDVCCNKQNKKCDYGIFDNALERDWIVPYDFEVDIIWCNPPHSLNKEFVKRAYDQWVKHNITIMMILPANTLCTNYAENWISPFAEYHPINRGFCKFLHEGKALDHSRNGYFVIIWRKHEE